MSRTVANLAANVAQPITPHTIMCPTVSCPIPRLTKLHVKRHAHLHPHQFAHDILPAPRALRLLAAVYVICSAIVSLTWPHQRGREWRKAFVTDTKLWRNNRNSVSHDACSIVDESMFNCCEQGKLKDMPGGPPLQERLAAMVPRYTPGLPQDRKQVLSLSPPVGLQI